MLLPRLKVADASEMSLVLTNVIVFLLVVLSGEDPTIIIFVFWAETAAIGFYSLLKMVAVAFYGLSGKSGKKIEAFASIPLLFFMVPFFTFHFGMFMFGHLVFLLAFFSGGFGATAESPLTWFRELVPTIFLPVLMLFISHGVSFFQNFIQKREYERMFTPQIMQMMPYGRVMVMHVLIFVFAFMVMLTPTGYRVVSAGVLVAVKVASDLMAHRREHNKS